MVDNNLVEIVCIIDRSGSMATIRADAEGGFNNFIDEQKKNIKNKKVKVTLAQFDTEYELLWNGKDLNKCEHYQLQPRGATALLDAIGKTVNDVGNRLSSLPENKRPGQIIVLIVTDGEENSSKEFTKEKVKDIIEHQKNKYSWDFTFLGTTESAIKDSVSWGISKSAAYDVTNSVAMYSAMSRNVTFAVNNNTEVSEKI